MQITARSYIGGAGITEDYQHIRAFLLRLGSVNFSYGRWDWLTTHTYLDKAAVDRIGIWEDDGSIVAITSFDTTLGQGYFAVQDGYAALKPDMFRYAAEHFADGDGQYAALIADDDAAMQAVAWETGFIPTQDKEYDAVYTCPKTGYSLPEGFHITSMADALNIYHYGLALYKGFDHEKDEGPYQFTPEAEAALRAEMCRPNVDLSLKIAVVAPDGEFAAYCGMWYDPAVDFAIVEPVATAPAYRKMGLGRAAVLEGIRRCYALGAKRAFVGSRQQFYYNIGFAPRLTSTFWRRKV